MILHSHLGFFQADNLKNPLKVLDGLCEQSQNKKNNHRRKI